MKILTGSFLFVGQSFLLPQSRIEVVARSSENPAEQNPLACRVAVVSGGDAGGFFNTDKPPAKFFRSARQRVCNQRAFTGRMDQQFFAERGVARTIKIIADVMDDHCERSSFSHWVVESSGFGQSG